MLKKTCMAVLLVIMLGAIYAEAAEKKITMVVNDQEILFSPAAMVYEGRLFVPLRFIAEAFKSDVQWDNLNKTVTITEQSHGDSYLKKQDALAPGIAANLIKPKDLVKILDDDKDKNLADYRTGHNGGDDPANDPLIVDLRNIGDYNEAHIPGAVWIDIAENMAETANIQKLQDMLNQHAANGGLKEIVLYCYTGNTSGLVCGVLGAQGLPVKNLINGFDIGWRGTRTADKPVKAPMENNDGQTILCGG